MIAQNSEVYNPPTFLFSLYMYMEKDLCRGVVYFTVLCDHPYLVSLLFAVLLSLHPVTFSNVFYYLFMSFFLAAVHATAICHHRAEVIVLTSSRSPSLLWYMDNIDSSIHTASIG